MAEEKKTEAEAKTLGGDGKEEKRSMTMIQAWLELDILASALFWAKPAWFPSDATMLERYIRCALRGVAFSLDGKAVALPCTEEGYPAPTPASDDATPVARVLPPTVRSTIKRQVGAVRPAHVKIWFNGSAGALVHSGVAFTLRRFPTSSLGHCFYDRKLAKSATGSSSSTMDDEPLVRAWRG